MQKTLDEIAEELRGNSEKSQLIMLSMAQGKHASPVHSRILFPQNHKKSKKILES